MTTRTTTRKRFDRQVCFGLATAAVLVAAGAARGERETLRGYPVRNVAERTGIELATDGNLRSFTLFDTNDRDEFALAVVHTDAGGVTRRSVMLWRDGAGTTLSVLDGSPIRTVAYAALNQRGEVAAYGGGYHHDDARFVVRVLVSSGDGRSLETWSAGPRYVYKRPIISDAGTVCVAAQSSDGTTVYRGAGVAMRPVASFDGHYPYGSAASTDMNNVGEIVQALRDRNGEITSLRRITGDTVETLHESSNSLFDPVINEAGTIVFGERGGGARATIKRIDGDTMSTIWSSPSEAIVPTNVRQSDEGTVVFSVGGRIVRCAPGVSETLVAAGDPLFGSTIERFSRHALSPGGVLAFAYTLSSGESGIAAMHLESPPAPSSRCPGDATGDGRTLLDDLSILAANFGAADLPHGWNQSLPSGDLNDDGDVGIADFAMLASEFGCGE